MLGNFTIKIITAEIICTQECRLNLHYSTAVLAVVASAGEYCLAVELASYLQHQVSVREK